MIDLPDDDPRSPSAVRSDAFIDEMRDTTAEMRELTATLRNFMSRPGNTQTVIHKTEGMGAWGAASVVACFFTVALMVLLTIVFVPDIHDLKAWQDILRKDVAKLQAERKP